MPWRRLIGVAFRRSIHLLLDDWWPCCRCRDRHDWWRGCSDIYNAILTGLGEVFLSRRQNSEREKRGSKIGVLHSHD